MRTSRRRKILREVCQVCLPLQFTFLSLHKILITKVTHSHGGNSQNTEKHIIETNNTYFNDLIWEYIPFCRHIYIIIWKHTNTLGTKCINYMQWFPQLHLWYFLGSLLFYEIERSKPLCVYVCVKARVPWMPLAPDETYWLLIRMMFLNNKIDKMKNKPLKVKYSY